MMPASDAIRWLWPVLLAMLVNFDSQYSHVLYPNDVFKYEIEAPNRRLQKAAFFSHFGVHKRVQPSNGSTM
jgi:hypothetical protein